MSVKTDGKLSVQEIISKADFIRKDLVDNCVENGAGHIAPSLSCVDILCVLYYGIMELSDDPKWAQRDRLVFSKAHGCYGLYAVLVDKGFISRETWTKFYKGSPLSGCVERDVRAGIEASTGSLGHGLPQAVGIAFGAKLKKRDFNVFCVIGDGELQEGSNWEAIQLAVKHKLNNLTVIVDNNRLQAMDFLENILTPEGRLDDLERKLSSFGVLVDSCDGHDIGQLKTVLRGWAGGREGLSGPQALLARTVKGYGLRCMENVPKFHFRIPTKEELEMGKRYE